MNTKTRTITERNPIEFNEVIQEISITTVDGLFDQLTASFKSHHDDNFVMQSNMVGKLFDNDNNLRMKIYKYCSDWNGFDHLVIETRDEVIEHEVKRLSWIWHNLDCEIS